jgi:hypothetical protein
MAIQTIEGKEVTVESARGPVTAVVIADLGEIVVIGRADDYLRAKQNGLSRYCVGFRRNDIVSVEGIDMKV